MRRLGSFIQWPLLASALLFLPNVHAHTAGEAHHLWTLDPLVLLPLLIFTLLYVAGVVVLRSRGHLTRAVQAPMLASAAIGFAALFFALIWPLDALSEESFAAHMAQHMLLVAVAAPLLALARTSIPIAAAIALVSPKASATLAHPRKWLRLCLRPSVAFMLHGAVIWIWHAPLLFELALQWRWLHVIEHASFLLTGYWYWAALLRNEQPHGEAYGAAALWSLSTLVHTGLLGALITFAPRPLYPAYLEAQGSIAAALQDQQLAGLLMWIPAGACYLLGGLAFAAAWLRAADIASQRSDNGSA